MGEIEKANLSGIEMSMFASVGEAADHILATRLNGFHNAIAINPEKIVRLRADQTLFNTVRAASINYPDGLGVCMALGKITGRRVVRIPGIELWEQLMHRSAAEATPVFILGGSPKVNSATVAKLRDMTGVAVAGHAHGYFESDDEIIDQIRQSGARITSVAMGSPRQELFIERCRERGLTGFFMGVGGTYDVFSGQTARAPGVFLALGLEWFYRLLREPVRIFRQRNLVVFVFLFLSGALFKTPRFGGR